MLKINDKIKYVKKNPCWGNLPIGIEMTVTDVVGTTIACVASNVVNGKTISRYNVIMSYDEFEKWFERVNDNIEKSESKQIWSGWRPITTNNALWCVRNIYRANRANNDMIYVQYLCNKYIITSDTDIWYRSKGNQVQVIFKFDNGTSIVANAKCNTKGGDTFDIKKGIGLGVLRCFIKTMIKDLDNIIRTL